jgi:hypothetical protein
VLSGVAAGARVRVPSDVLHILLHGVLDNVLVVAPVVRLLVLVASCVTVRCAAGSRGVPLGLRRASSPAASTGVRPPVAFSSARNWEPSDKP